MTDHVFVVRLVVGDDYSLSSQYRGSRVYRRESDAVQGALKLLVESNLIDSERYAEDQKKCESWDATTMLEELADKVTDYDALHEVCKEHGNSYYEQGWKFLIERCLIN